MEKSNTTKRNKRLIQNVCVTPSSSSSRELSYLWIAEPEVQTAEVGEEAEASEENPVLETGNKQVGGKKSNINSSDGWMDRISLLSILCQ